MVKVAWKVINGNGPYAYLQKSVKHPDGTVTSEHIAYLGGIKPGGPVPGKSLTLSDTKHGQYDGTRVKINPVPKALKESLSDNALAKLASIEAQVKEGVPSHGIVFKKGNEKLGATTRNSATGPKHKASKAPSPVNSGQPIQGYLEKLSAAAEKGQTKGELAGAFSAVDAEVEHLKTLPGPENVLLTVHHGNIQGHGDGIKQQLLTAELAGKIPPTADPQDVKELVRVAVHSGANGMEATAATLVAKSTTQDRKESIPVVAANIKLVLQRKTRAGSPPYQASSAPSLPLSYHPPISKPYHYANLEQVATSGFADGGIAGAVTAVQQRAQELKDDLGESQGPAVNVARRRLLTRLLNAWITDQVEASNLPALTRAPLTRELASAATRGLPKFDEKVQALSTQPADDQVKYVQSVAGLVKAHLSDQLAHDITWQPDPAPEAPVVPTDAEPADAAQDPDANPPTTAPPVTAAAAPKLSPAPKGPNGKPLISAINVKKLEQAAASGHVETLDLLVAQIDAKLLAPAKKEALKSAAAELKQHMGPPAVVPQEMVNLGTVLQSVAAKKAAAAASESRQHQPDADHSPAAAAEIGDPPLIYQSAPSTGGDDQSEKDWDADLVQISGPKGSNQGGLFTDTKSGAKHYVKLSNSDVRARLETLAGLLYEYAGVPVPELRTIDFKGQTAVMSDWIEGAKSMTAAAMTTHPDVRNNFAVDAWLGNWDVVGLGFDNIVQGASGEAYRIDLGGSLLFRAQGQPKAFPPFVEELDTMRKPSVNKSSARVFKAISQQELLTGAQKVASVTDEQIDAAVDQMQLPKTSPDYADTEDLPATLKWRLKKRRDHVVQQIQKQAGPSASAEDPISPPVETPAAPAAPLSTTTSDPAPAEPATGPKISDVPSNYAGNPLIAASNVAKLEKAAATGSVDALDKAAGEIKSKKIGYLKKAAINKAVLELKAHMAEQPSREPVSDTGMSAAVEAVNDGDVKMPGRPVPDPEVVQRHVDLQEKGKKDWDADLIQVEGKKGSTEGALFKDQQLDTLHYVKWSDSDARVRVEALTGALYTLADVPVPMQRVIDFKGQTAVMSDWLEDASPMTVAQLQKHPDVRGNFAVDAWIANWDVIGANGVNVVKGPGEKAYRVDLGGSLLFRAMGSGKDFPAKVAELTTLTDPGKNAVAAQVFGDLTDAELRAGAEKVGKISDQAIDDTVDQMEIPKTSPHYPASQYGAAAKDLPRFLKTRLKERRDYVAKEVLNIIDLKQQKAEEAEKQIAQLKDASELKPETLQVVVEQVPKMKLHMTNAARRSVQDQVLRAELGKTKGSKASSAVSSTYNTWKGSTNTPGGRLMRWATGAIDGTGIRELRRLQKFNDFLVAQNELSQQQSAKQIAEVNAAAASDKGQNLTQGLRVTRKSNRVASVLQNPGETHVTVYRGWRPIQVKYLKLATTNVGDMVELEDPPVYSWSFDLQTAKNFGHGSIVTKAEVPIDKLILTDRINNTGSYSGENEVLFKGVDKQEMEVLYKY